MLKLADAQLLGGLRRRIIQVRAVQRGARSRLVKTLRAHVAAALEHGLRPAEAMPLTLVVGERISCDLVRQAVAHLLAQVDPPEREPRTLAAQLLAEYFTVSAAEIGLELHGEAGDHEEDLALVRADAAEHLGALRQLIGPELARTIGLRAQNKSLVEIANGRYAVSTVHDHQRTAVLRLREHAQKLGLGREDLAPVLPSLAA